MLCWSALRPGGRLVVHAVTVETEMIIADVGSDMGGELTRIAVEHLERSAAITAGSRPGPSCSGA